MNTGIPILIRENRMNNKSYNWMKGYYQFQLFKEIVIPVMERNQKNSDTTKVRYDIYD